MSFPDEDPDPGEGDSTSLTEESHPDEAVPDPGDGSVPLWIWGAIALLVGMLALADSQCGLADHPVTNSEEPHPMY